MRRRRIEADLDAWERESEAAREAEAKLAAHEYSLLLAASRDAAREAEAAAGTARKASNRAREAASRLPSKYDLRYFGLQDLEGRLP